MAQKITQALIYAEVQNVKEIIKEHTKTDVENFMELRKSLEGTEANPGIKVRVDRLEQTEAARRRHFGYLWAAIAACLGGVIKALWP